MTNYSLLVKAKYKVGDVVWFREFHLLDDFPLNPDVYFKWNCGMIIKKTWLELEKQVGYQLDCDKGFQKGRYLPEEVLYDRREV